MIRIVTLAVLFGLGCVDLSRPLPTDGAVRAEVSREGGGSQTPDVPGLPSDGQPAPMLLVNGAPCLANDACQSQRCIDGICCATACDGLCHSCAISGSLGTCALVPPDLDPRNVCAASPVSTCGLDGTCDGAGACRLYPLGTECTPGSCDQTTQFSARLCDGKGTCGPATPRSCAPNVCSEGSCAEICANQTDCQPGFFCDADKRCRTKKTQATACTDGAQCSSGFCRDGVCCNNDCAQICNACNLPGSAGTCTMVPDGQDTHNDCPMDPEAGCGRTGSCNGAGACRLYPPGTLCRTGSCSGSTETTAGICNGAGSCAAGSTRSCSPYVCGSAACATSCTANAGCVAPNVCTNGACSPRPAGLVLYWAFDEAAGSQAMDSSGNGFHGVYTGESGTPTPSTNVPTLMFPNPRSRSFSTGNRQFVRLAGMSSTLKPGNNFTVSVWFRATSTPAATEIVTGGGAYALRFRSSQVEFFKGTGGGGGIYLRGTVSNHLNGAWHHLAGVQTPSGMKVYFDGVERGSDDDGSNAVYDQSNDFLVGRHIEFASWDLAGNADEVRFYQRALSASEIAALAQGRN